jgi:hypothetical protein
VQAGTMRPAPRLLDAAAPADTLNNIDTLVLDCDGVLWQGDDLIPGSAEALLKLR